MNQPSVVLNLKLDAGAGASVFEANVKAETEIEIEHTDAPLYLPLQDVGVQANLDATCTVTALDFGDLNNDQLLDVFGATPLSS